MNRGAEKFIGCAVSQIVEAISAEQIEQVRHLFRQYQSELPVHLRSFDSELSALPGVYGPPAGKLLLAMVYGQSVGCVGIRPFPRPDTCEMKRLYVRPLFGAENWRAAGGTSHREARALGYRWFRLDTHPPTMQAALGCTELGFKEISPENPVEGLLYMECSL